MGKWSWGLLPGELRPRGILYRANDAGITPDVEHDNLASLVKVGRVDPRHHRCANGARVNQTVRRTKINADAAIGVITTASFATGVALISRSRHFNLNFDAALFGNVLGVSQSDVWVVVGVTLLIAVVIFFMYKQLLFTTFQSEVAEVYGVRTQWVDTLFALVLAATLIASMQILGVTLIAAALIIPAIMARLLTDSFNRMSVISTIVGAATGLLGIYLSYYLDVASGASIVLLQALLFSVVLVIISLQKNASRRLISTDV